MKRTILAVLLLFFATLANAGGFNSGNDLLAYVLLNVFLPIGDFVRDTLQELPTAKQLAQRPQFALPMPLLKNRLEM